MQTIEIGPNLLQAALALIALVGTVSGYYFGYRSGKNNSLKNPPDPAAKNNEESK